MKFVHPQELKKQVLDEIKLGGSIRQASRKYNLHQSTIQYWVRGGKEINKKKINGALTYKKKSAEIEAIEWTGNNWYEVFLFCGYKNITPIEKESRHKLKINTIKGQRVVFKGDFIIKGLIGEFYPCRPKVFHEKYELKK